MGIALELLMVSDKEIADLLDRPAAMKAFLDEKWSGAESSKGHEVRRSISIRNIYSDVHALLKCEPPARELPVGFIEGYGRIIGNVVRANKLDTGDEIIQWNEYDNDFFGYGPPSAFFSNEVSQIRDALAQVDDEWVRKAFDPDRLLSANERERFTPADFAERVQACQESIGELKLFISRSASAGAGVVQFLW